MPGNARNAVHFIGAHPWLALTCVILACGGAGERADSEPGPEPEGCEAPATNAAELPDGAAEAYERLSMLPDGGPPSLEEYAGQRSAASPTVQITRRGCPITVEYQIKSAPRDEFRDVRP